MALDLNKFSEDDRLKISVLNQNLFSPQQLNSRSLQCRICMVPVSTNNKSKLCGACYSQSKQPHELADKVVPLTFAMYGTAAYKLMHDYKNLNNKNRAKYQQFLELFFNTAMATFGNCISGSKPFSAISIVPSTDHAKKGQHPLEAITRNYLPALPRIDTFFTKVRELREIDPWYAQFHSIDKNVLSHVLVVEDTWVTGSTAQSLASALKMRGAKKVTIVPIARALNKKIPVASIVEKRIQETRFDWNVCPNCGNQH